MTDGNKDFSLFGDLDLKKELKSYIKQNKSMIMILILLSMVGSFFYMMSIGYTMMQIIFVYVVVVVAFMFLMKTIIGMIKGSGNTKKPIHDRSEDELIQIRSKRQQEIKGIDNVLNARKKNLKKEIKRINAAQNGRVPERVVEKKE